MHSNMGVPTTQDRAADSHEKAMQSVQHTGIMISGPTMATPTITKHTTRKANTRIEWTLFIENVEGERFVVINSYVPNYRAVSRDDAGMMMEIGISN
jgi:hypothetical protein